VFKLRRWLRRPWKCKFGFHTKDKTEWSMALGSGLINFHCAKCQKIIKTIPLDDAPNSNRVFKVLDMVKYMDPLDDEMG